MKIELGTLDTTQYKTLSKYLLGLIPVLLALWNTPSVHDVIKPLLDSHPHWTQAIMSVAAAYAVMHNPKSNGEAPAITKPDGS